MNILKDKEKFNKNLIKMIVALLMYFAYRVSITDFWQIVFHMEPFVMVDALKIVFAYSLFDAVVFFLVLGYLLHSEWEFSNPLYEKICSAIFSFCILGGSVMKQLGEFTTLFRTLRMLMFYPVFFVGTYYILRCLCWNLRRLFNNLIDKDRAAGDSLPEKKELLFHFVLFFICWLPYIIVRYPAGFEFDGYHQILQFFDGNINAHWPPASTVWMGVFVLAGSKLFGSTNIGIFSYCLLQIIIGSLVFSYCIVVMKRFRVPVLFRRLSALVFAFVPIYPGYISSVVKDAPFAYMVLLFVLLFAQIAFGKSVGIMDCVKTAIVGFLMCILRNNGVFILFGIILILLIASLIKRHIFKLPILIMCTAVIALFTVYNSVLLPSLGIGATSAGEAFSVPFQQTARLAVNNPESISDEDIEIINRILDYDSIVQNYEPALSDPVKASYHCEKTSDLIAYLKVWLVQGLKNPGIYIDAFLDNARGFIYPDIRMGNSNVVSGVYSSIYNSGSVIFPMSDSNMEKRVNFRNWVSFIENLPVVFPFVNIAIQLWIPVYLLAYGISRKKKDFLLILIPSIIGVLVCLASPTYDNNGARYALPVIYANMFMIGMGYQNRKDCENS